MAGQRQGGSPRGRKGSRKNKASAAEKKACGEEKAMKDVLRMLAGSPNLPAKFLNIARGMLLLDNPKILQEISGSPAGGRGAGQSRRGSIATVSSTTKGSEQNIGKGVPAEANPAVAGSEGRKNAVAPEQGADPDNRNSDRFKEQDQEEKKYEAARSLELHRGVLRDWATKRRRSGAMKIAEVGLKALRSKCLKTTVQFRDHVLTHLRSVKDPSKVCRNLGVVASALIGELELMGERSAETESETNSGDHNNDSSSATTMTSAFGREDGRADGDGTVVQGDSNVSGSTFGTRGVGGSKQVATAAKTSPSTSSTPSPSPCHPAPPIAAMTTNVPGTAYPPRPTSDQTTPNSSALGGNRQVSPGVRQEGSQVEDRRESGTSPHVAKPEVGQEKRLVGMFSPITVVAGRCRRIAGSGGARDEAQVCADKSGHVNLKRNPQQWPVSQKLCTAGAGGYEGGTASGRGVSAAPISVPGSAPPSYTGNLTSLLRANSSEKTTVTTATTTKESMLASSSATGVEPGQGRNVTTHRQRQKGAVGVGANSKAPGIGERCDGVRHELEGLDDILGDMDGGNSPTAARGLDVVTATNRTAMEEVQDILNEMNRAPGYRDLVLEEDAFTTIKQLLSWTPPPKWERSRDRHKAQLIAAAGVILKKALMLDGPPGFWPLPLEGPSGDGVQRWKMSAAVVPVLIFRRKKILRKAAGGDARSGGRTRHGVWSFGVSGFRYASKPPVLPAARIP